MRIHRFLPALPLVTALACIHTPPPHERALLNNELCAQQLGVDNLRQAEVYCDLGLEFSPQYADLWSNKGLIALKAGRKSEAKDHFIKALRYNQEHAAAYMNLGYIYLEDEAYGKAHDNFQRALKVNPDYIEARYNLAITFMKMNKMEQAKKEFRTLLAVNPNVADAHHSLGIIAYGEKDYDESVAQISSATQLNPNVPDYWNDLGVALMEISRFAEAKEAFGSCVRLDDKNPQCINNLAISQRKAALTDTALRELRDTQQAENTAPALYMLARQYREKGLLGEEERTYKKCLGLDKKYAACHYGLYELYSDAAKQDAAEVACKNFLKYASADESPTEYQTCEKFLSSSAN
ncbi:tetratricopeptide repeat protein [Myxococcaceae bacterium GXIMD 01537]